MKNIAEIKLDLNLISKIGKDKNGYLTELVMNNIVSVPNLAEFSTKFMFESMGKVLWMPKRLGSNFRHLQAHLDDGCHLMITERGKDYMVVTLVVDDICSSVELEDVKEPSFKVCEECKDSSRTTTQVVPVRYQGICELNLDVDIWNRGIPARFATANQKVCSGFVFEDGVSDEEKGEILSIIHEQFTGINASMKDESTVCFETKEFDGEIPTAVVLFEKQSDGSVKLVYVEKV